MLLPLLLGAGAILLLMSKSEPSPLDKLRAMRESPAYKTGYKDGLAYGQKMWSTKAPAMSAEKAEASAEGKASGDPKAYALGFTQGQSDGFSAAMKGAKTAPAKTTTTTTTPAKTTTTPPASTPTDFASANEAAIAGWTDGLALSPASSKNTSYLAWFNKGRYTRGYEDYRLTGGSEKYSSDSAYVDGWLQAYNGEPNPYGTGP